MDFTRQPIIETVVTPREGYRLVVRSSKGAGSEEHFVDALEVVSFGSNVFFRCLEKPKPFMVPASDYEVLEVREPRMVLKTPSEQGVKVPAQRQKPEPQKAEVAVVQEAAQAEARPERQAERSEKRRDRRRGFRRRRGQGREEAARPEGGQEPAFPEEMREEQSAEMAPLSTLAEGEGQVISSTPLLSSILPPPTKLIRDDLKRLREDYKGAFYMTEEKDRSRDDDDTTGEEDLPFREAPFDISEEDIRMSEGGDAEVPQEDPFRPSALKEEANTGSSQDVQKDLG